MPPKRAGHQSSATGRRFEFINASGPGLHGDAETRRRVRSHAQADYRRQVQHPQRHRYIEIDISPLLDGSLRSRAPVAVLTPGPASILNASRSDPFAAFDVPDNQRARLLWDHGMFSLPCRGRPDHKQQSTMGRAQSFGR